jgi:glyoxylase-like metal-dependent hydrolase (beta-lactamase superfamily II)
MKLLRQRGIPVASLQGGMRAWSLAWNVAPVALANSPAEIIQLRRTGKGCLSYLIGSNGVAAVIDAAVEPEAYIGLAAARDWKIQSVVETHIHADHLSRGRVLAERLDATLYLPAQQRVSYPFTPLHDGDGFALGSSRLDVLGSPGHTFESACYLLDRTALFTGDTLFLSTVGRPDLAAKADEETRTRARLLYASLRKLLNLSRETLVLPGHTSEPIAFDRTPITARLGDVRSKATLLALSEAEFVDAIVARIPPPPGNHLTIVQYNERGELPDDPTTLEAGANRCAIG